jgi:DNA-binding IclR family transcriptional regulator
MARDLALPRSTTYHLLQTMMDAGYVTHYPDQRVYGLGLSAYELASGYMRQEPLQRLARRPLADLADRSGHSAHLSVLHGREVVYVIEERAPGRVRLITDVGVRLPAHTTASGRALLAELPPAQVRALYPSAKDLRRDPPSGPQTPIELRRLLSDVRTAGVATEEGEVTAGQASLARAVVDASGYPVVAVAVTYPVEARTADLLEDLKRHLDRTVHTLAQRLGAER